MITMNSLNVNLTDSDIDTLPETKRVVVRTRKSVHKPGHAMPDVQSSADSRHIAIQKVGVKAVRYPIRVKTVSGVQSSIGTWNMTVHLSEQNKGTHMSRFIALLEKTGAPDAPALDIAEFGEMIRRMLISLEADCGQIEVSFPYFINKTAPVSGVQSLMDYEVGLSGEIKNGVLEITQKVLVPVTSLCPCSKEISAYGAHNQRSHITVQALMAGNFPVDELIAKIEA
jgi:GTP cyclohydrolase IB